jgi:L-arabinokinase
MAIVFYISGHGFGHASRDVEVINRLGITGSDPIVIRSSVSPDLLARTLTVPYDLRRGVCDTGIVQSSSITHDDAATVAEAQAFYRTFDRRIEAEVAALSDLDVQAIVGDIPPLAFATAAVLGVPSIALGNFTWDWIYETHPGFLPDGAVTVELIRDCYRRVDLALELPFSGGFEIFSRVERLPLVARHASQPAAATRAHFGLPAEGRVALLSFGGYGLPSLDLSRLDCRHGWTIVTTDRVTAGSVAPPNVRVVMEQEFIGSQYRYEDLVAAADVVITKPGYGIIAECISTGTALVYTSRGQFREYDVLVAALPRVLRSQFISHAELFAGRWLAVLEDVLAQPEPPAHMDTGGAEQAARLINAAASTGLQRRA